MRRLLFPVLFVAACSDGPLENAQTIDPDTLLPVGGTMPPPIRAFGRVTGPDTAGAYDVALWVNKAEPCSSDNPGEELARGYANNIGYFSFSLTYGRYCVNVYARRAGQLVRLNADSVLFDYHTADSLNLQLPAGPGPWERRPSY